MSDTTSETLAEAFESCLRPFMEGVFSARAGAADVSAAGNVSAVVDLALPIVSQWLASDPRVKAAIASAPRSVDDNRVSLHVFFGVERLGDCSGTDHRDDDNALCAMAARWVTR